MKKKIREGFFGSLFTKETQGKEIINNSKTLNFISKNYNSFIDRFNRDKDKSKGKKINILNKISIPFIYLFWKKQEILLFLVVLLLPISGFVPSVPGIGLSSLICLELALFFLMITKKIYYKEKFVESWQSIILIGIFILIIFSGLFLKKPLDLVYPAANFFFYALLPFFLIINISKSKKTIKALILAMIIIGVLASFHSIYNFITGGDITIIGDVNYVSSFIIALLPLSLIFLTKKSKLIVFSILSLFLIVLIISTSRGALLSLLILILLFIFSEKNKFKKISFKRLKKPLIIILLLFLLILSILPMTTIKNFNPLEYRGLTRAPLKRARIYYYGIEMFLDNFWTGVGWRNFKDRLPYYLGKNTAAFYGETKRAPHNFLLQFGAELGIFGLLALLSLIIFTFKDLSFIRKKDKKLGKILFFSFIGLLITLLFLQTREWFWLIIALIVNTKYVLKNED